VACSEHDSKTINNSNKPNTITDSQTNQSDIEHIIVDNDSHTSNIVSRDERFPLKAYNGQLGLQAEFNFEDLSKITLLSALQTSIEQLEPIILDEMDTQLIRQNLFWLDLDAAKVDLPSMFTPHPILIKLVVNDEEYELTYDLNLNAYMIRSDYYYADNQVTKLMHLYFNPDSKLATVARLQQLDSIEYSMVEDAALHFYEHLYEFERFNINNLDYHGWYKLVEEHDSTEQIGLEHNIAIPYLTPLLYNAKLDILFSDAFYFFSDQFETKDGIKVGLSKDEVLKKLGKPNYETSVRWSYYIGDYLKFHLYFEDDKIKVISLTLPI